MLTKNLIALCLWTLSLPLFASTTFTLTCPKQIEVQQKLQEKVQGWNVSQSDTRHFLAGIIFYINDERGLLKPESINKKKNRWTFNLEDKVYIVCQYNQTTVQLTQLLPAKTKECFVNYNLLVQGDRGYLPEAVKCNANRNAISKSDS